MAAHGTLPGDAWQTDHRLIRNLFAAIICGRQASSWAITRGRWRMIWRKANRGDRSEAAGDGHKILKEI
jgi:hypothetical protein